MSALGLGSAAALAGLFIAQVTLAVAWQGDEARTVASLTWLGWGYIGLALLIFVRNANAFPPLVKSLWSFGPDSGREDLR
ncbi:hypothetical protein [Tardiphaga sp.]|uniref:hypothetical protein n=1 Tax=Tardiphaga sp. TaxID=1926292 RepID=UPI00352B6397